MTPATAREWPRTVSSSQGNPTERRLAAAGWVLWAPGEWHHAASGIVVLRSGRGWWAVGGDGIDVRGDTLGGVADTALELARRGGVA